MSQNIHSVFQVNIIPQLSGNPAVESEPAPDVFGPPSSPNRSLVKQETGSGQSKSNATSPQRGVHLSLQATIWVKFRPATWKAC